MSPGIFSIPAQAFGWAGPWALFAAVVVYIVRQRPKMRELQDSSDGSLRRDLMALLAMRDARIAKLEEEAVAERADCNRRIAALEQMAFGNGAASTLGTAL